MSEQVEALKAQDKSTRILEKFCIALSEVQGNNKLMDADIRLLHFWLDEAIKEHQKGSD